MDCLLHPYNLSSLCAGLVFCICRGRLEPPEYAGVVLHLSSLPPSCSALFFNMGQCCAAVRSPLPHGSCAPSVCILGHSSRVPFD